MSADSVHADQVPIWTIIPNDTDWLAWTAIVTIGFGAYFVVYLYAKFDRWAEHKSEGTPLAKTIPTLLAIALLYEIFPLDHFHVLLPLSAILIAVIADWTHHQAGSGPTDSSIVPTVGEEASTGEVGTNPEKVANG